MKKESNKRFDKPAVFWYNLVVSKLREAQPRPPKKRAAKAAVLNKG